MRRPSRPAWALAALLPAAAGAAPLELGAGAEPGGTLLGRVCLDMDRDGACGPGEPGVAGARVMGAAGQMALADGAGRFHFLEVPARLLVGDRLAYGGQRVKVEGLAAARLVDLPPEGAAQVDLAVPVDPARPPSLEAAGVPGAPPRREGGRLRWPLGGRTTPGARVSAGGTRATASDDGTFALEVPLAPGDNAFGVTVAAPDGQAALYRWPVHLAPRAEGGDLVIPERPALLAAFAVQAAAGGALVHGYASVGTRVRVGRVAASPGPGGVFAAYGRADGGGLEVVLDDGRGEPVVLAVEPGEAGALTAAALAEVEVAFGGDPGVLVSGRGTGSVRGTMGPATLEAGVDLDDRDRKLADLARPRDGLAGEHALDPERTFLASGDEGAAGDSNPARGRIWARLRAPDLRLDLGPVRTDLGGTELGRHDRALFGALASVGRDLGPLRLEASAFGASLRTDARGSAPPRGSRETFAAHGGASYWLAHAQVVPGSEAVEVEWRDPFTGLLTARRTLVRGGDYEVDWISGRLVLARPLPSVAAPAAVETGAPSLGAAATLTVDYQHAALGPGGEDVQGGRGGARLGPLALEVRGVREERSTAAERYRLGAAGASLDLGDLAVRAEAARSEGDPGGDPLLRSADGGHTFEPPLAPGRGEAVHLEVRGGHGPLRAKAWWRDRTAGYSDGTLQEAVDAREQGASVDLEGASLSASLTWAERRGTPPGAPAAGPGEDVRRVVGRGRWRGERLEAVAEVVDAERIEPARGEELSAGARLTWRADPRLSLDLSHHQGLRTTGSGVDPTFTAAGATMDVGGSRLSVRGGWGPDLGPRLLASGERARAGEAVYGTFTADPDAPSVLPGAGRSLGGGPADGSAAALGARRRAGSTEVYTEEQVGRDAFGLRAGRVAGLALEPLRGLRLALSGERGVRLAPDGSERQRTAAAGSAGLVLGPVRVAARGELRREGGGHVHAAGGSLEWRASGPLTLSARASWADGDLSGVRARLLDLSAGGALRLARGALLATVTRLVERRPGAVERRGVLGRMAATAELGGRLSLGAGAGMAVQRVGGGRDDRLSGSVRASVRLMGPLDLGGEAARRGPLGRDRDVGSRSALRAELGLRMATGRLALGYHLVGFSGDGLSPDEQVGRLFLRAQLVY